MRAGHDPSSGTAAHASAGDVLSDVLGSVRLTGSMLFLVDATAPWRSWAPESEAFRPSVLPRSQHLISYHIVTRGGCWAGLQGAAPERFEAGDTLVVPHGDAYFLADPADARPAYGADEAVDFFRRMAAGELPTSINAGGAGAAGTQFLCAFLGCQRLPFNPVLAALPRAIHLRGTDPAAERLRHLVRFALAELRERSPGGQGVLASLAELMFVEVVRQHLAQAEGPVSGWLGGLRDPLVARALALLHADLASRWTIDTLATAAGTSRSVLAERFTQCVGMPPMRYLTRWRMQRATHLLGQPGTNKVVAVAEAVGYSSEAAFSRAFTKHAGMSPSVWRARTG